MAAKKELKASQRDELLGVLRTRFEDNMQRHEGLDWASVQKKLNGKSDRLWALHEMERTGGEPDVVMLDGKARDLAFVDCAMESPKGRRSVCYDAEALAARKQNKPKDSAAAMAAAMGIDMLSEQEYRQLQAIEEFDMKTSSWILTPAAIRELGGALFCDRRYDAVFTYHNGAESYYAARGFRGILRI